MQLYSYCVLCGWTLQANHLCKCCNYINMYGIKGIRTVRARRLKPPQFYLSLHRIVVFLHLNYLAISNIQPPSIEQAPSPMHNGITQQLGQIINHYSNTTSILQGSLNCKIYKCNFYCIGKPAGFACEVCSSGMVQSMIIKSCNRIPQGWLYIVLQYTYQNKE